MINCLSFFFFLNSNSPLGGYRCCNGGNPPLGRTAELLIRWAQMGAFNSLMENGGDNEHRPWMFDDTNTTLSAHRNFISSSSVCLSVDLFF